MTEIPRPEEQPTLSVEQAGRLCGLGRTAAYEAVRRGELPSLHFGRTVRVPTASLRVLLGIDLNSTSPSDSERADDGVDPHQAPRA